MAAWGLLVRFRFTPIMEMCHQTSTKRMKVGNEMSIHAPSTLAPRILCTGSGSSKTTNPKLGSFPPTPLVLIRSSTTFPYAARKKILCYLIIFIQTVDVFTAHTQVLLFKETYSWRNLWARSHQCHVGGCQQKAGGCLGNGQSACCPCHRIQSLPCHLQDKTTGTRKPRSAHIIICIKIQESKIPGNKKVKLMPHVLTEYYYFSNQRKIYNLFLWFI